MTSAKPSIFDQRASTLLHTLREGGQYKHLRVIDGPMDATIKIRGDDGKFREALCFCSNSYLGLANHPEVVEAGIKGLRTYGAGTASVRFICGTFVPHEVLEGTIARYMGTESAYTFVSGWTVSPDPLHAPANATLLGPSGRIPSPAAITTRAKPNSLAARPHATPCRPSDSSDKKHLRLQQLQSIGRQ